MRIFLDDEPMTVAKPTLAAAFAEVRRQAEQRKRVIVEATIDGLAIPDEALAEPPDEEFPGSELRFITDDPVGLVRRTLMQVAESLDETTRMQALAAEQIQAGGLDRAMKSLSEALGSWANVQNAISSGTSLLGLSVDRMRVGDRAVGACVESLASRLTEVKRSIGAQDWAGLADVLAFDMQEQAAAWKMVLTGLADQLAPSEAGTGPEPQP